MEDFLAHSNGCELALRKMGHEQVFCHVGDNGRLLVHVLRPVVSLTKFIVRIDTPNGLAPPLITGTFGSADFLHSLKGEIAE